MIALLIAIIYFAFVSLGLPDSLLGSAWASMSAEINAPISAAGIITMIIAGSTILSSLLSNFANNKLGTGLVTAISTLITAGAMFGFSTCTKFWQICLWAVPYGLGAGAIDAALNNYVALHFSSRHMNWLHCCWGVGAAISPYIMGFCLSKELGWQRGYQTVSIIQLVLTVILFASLPLWKKVRQQDATPIVPSKTKDALKLRGVWLMFLMFFAYCALEQTAMLWASTYFTLYHNLQKDTAAILSTLFCSGMMAGRFLCGLFSNKMKDKNLIRLGASIVTVGIVAIFIPVKTSMVAFVGFALIGIGCAPIYPAIIHSTPTNFGAENSQALVGVQMAFAYIGSTFMPPLFGLLVEKGKWVMPVYLTAFAVVMITLSEILNIILKKSRSEHEELS